MTGTQACPLTLSPRSSRQAEVPGGWKLTPWAGPPVRSGRRPTLPTPRGPAGPLLRSRRADLQPTITTSLRRAHEIPCMIICSGTSRLVVIGGESLPEAGPPRDQLLLDLMLGKPHGLGGEGSQANKVAVVTTDRRRGAFHFHFYQIIRQTGQLMDRMECSNAAAAAGLFARLSRMARPAPGRSLLQTTNTATGQRILLSIPDHEEMWKHPWGVRFELDSEVTELVQGCSDACQMEIDGRVITYHLVPHGNLFVFCQVPPQEMTPALSLEIARQAGERAVELGRARRPFLPKIIPYQVVDRTHVEAASFFEGERHASMPGSASMALVLFLLLVRGELLSPLQEHEPEVEVRFQGGSIRVRVGMEQGRACYTEFFTPVRLLLHGAAPVPPGHSFMIEVPSGEPV